MNMILRLLLVYGSFLIGAIGPALFDSHMLATAWMTIWCMVTLGMAMWSKSWRV